MSFKNGFYKFGYWDDENEKLDDSGLVLLGGDQLSILEDPIGYLNTLFNGGNIHVDEAIKVMKGVNNNHYAHFSYTDEESLHNKYKNHFKPRHNFFKSQINPSLNIRSVAESYMGSKGKSLTHPPKIKVNEGRASRIAQAYHEMKHEPNSPPVKKAYDALKQETLDQFKHIQQTGLKVSRMRPGQENPYKTSKDLMRDIHENNHMWFFPTEQGYGQSDSPSSHPLLEPTDVMHDGRPLLANDVFRIVHDYFGHVKEGHGFGPQGEENAWHNHMQMYSPEAQKALTAETRGQNSWVNFGPHAEHNRKNPSQTIYAEQKAGLLPDWAMEHHPDDIAKSGDAIADDLEKTRPSISFPNLSKVPTRAETNVQQIETGRQKKMFGLRVAAAQGIEGPNAKALGSIIEGKFGRSVVGQSITTDEGPRSGALVGKLRSKYESFDDAHEAKMAEHKEKRLQAIKEHNQAVDTWNKKAQEIRQRFVSEDAEKHADTLKEWEEHKKLVPKFKAPRAPTKKARKTKDLTPEQQAVRGRSVDATLHHEGFHDTMRHIRRNYGQAAVDKVRSTMIGHYDPETVSVLKSFIEKIGYRHNSPYFNEEVLAHARDILVNDSKRDYFKQHAGADADKHIKNLKSGLQRSHEWAKNVTPEELVKGEEFKGEVLDTLIQLIDNLDDVEKSKNVREQKAKIFGTDPNAPRTSKKRMKMMQALRDYVKRQYGVSLVTASGKRDESGELREEKPYTHSPFDVFSEEGLKQEAELNRKIEQEHHVKMMTPDGRRLTDITNQLKEIKEKHGESPEDPEVLNQRRALLLESKSLRSKLNLPKRTDPKPDWRSGDLETQPSPDAAVHEVAHLNLAPEGMNLPEYQTEMDRLWGESQSRFGHMQQKKIQGEIQPMSIENPIRREMGLPANRTTKPVKRQEYALDDPSQPRFVEAKTSEGKKAFYDRQSRLSTPETKERMQQIREGSLKFDPQKGWYKASDLNALINLRGRGLKEEAGARLRTKPITQPAGSLVVPDELEKSGQYLDNSDPISERLEDMIENLAKARGALPVWDMEYEIDPELEKSDKTQEDLSEHHGKDVFVYFNLHKKVWSIKDRKTGVVVAHSKKVAVDNPQFKVSEAGRQRVLRDQAKNVHAGVVGRLNAHHADFSTEGRKRVSYNPYKHGHFYESDTQKAVHSADHVTLHVEDKTSEGGKVIRIPHVYAKDPKSDLKKSKELNPDSLGKSPVRSPRKGHTIAQLQNLKEMGWHNPDTGTEISEEEGEDHLWNLRQKKADKQIKEMLKPKESKAPSSDRPEDWFDKEEKIPGGLSSGKNPEDFDQEQLAAGIKVEMEHTNDKDIAREIAMDHLSEDLNYYKKLKTMEKSNNCGCDISKGKIGPECKQKLKAYSRRKGWQYPSAVVHLQAGRICGSKTKSESSNEDSKDELNKDLRRWVKEKWTNAKGETEHGSGKTGWRPTVRVSDKTPDTWGEMSPSEKKKKKENKQKANRKGGGWSTHESGRKQVWNTKKSEALEKGLSRQELESQGYKFKILNPTKRREAYAVTAHHNGKRVGHILYSRNPRLGSREETAHEKGFHEVYRAEVQPEHRNKGLYQQMLSIAADHVKGIGSKGLMSEGFQRSPDATRAWDKAGSFAVDTKGSSIKPLPYGADYFIEKSELEKGIKEMAIGAVMAGTLLPPGAIKESESPKAGQAVEIRNKKLETYAPGNAPKYQHLAPNEILEDYKNPAHLETEQHYEKAYGLPPGLITAIRLAGEKSNWSQSSEHNTLSPYQFTTGSRRLYHKKYDVDAHRDTDSAIHATALHLKESLDFVNKNKKFKSKSNHERAVLAAQHFHAGPNINNWGPVNRAYASRISRGLKALQINPKIQDLDLESSPQRSIASNDSKKLAKAKKIAEIAKSLALKKIGQMTHSTQPASVGHDVFQKDLEAAMGSFSVDNAGIRSLNDRKKEDDRKNSLEQVPNNHRKKFEKAMEEAESGRHILDKIMMLKSKIDPNNGDE